MYSLSGRLRAGVSLIALAVSVQFAAGHAFAQGNTAAQDNAATPSVEEVTVTGTSIAGISPPGANVITADQTAIEDSGAVDSLEAVKTIPDVTSSQGTSQGKVGAQDFSPGIHGLGASASSSTLVLVDGHRIPLSGETHPVPDPGLIPTIALEQVQVLPDGASSVYGSDAIAGVINFITRPSFEGAQFSAQEGFANGYNTYAANGIFGSTIGSTSAYMAISYSDESALANTARSFAHGNHTNLGGTNFKSVYCSPATIQPNGTGNLYLSDTATTSFANTTANAPCDEGVYGDILPPQVRTDIFAKVTRDFGSNLTVSMDIDYGDRQDNQLVDAGTVSATVFGSGPQANPFYVNPPGVTATQQTIRWDATPLLGEGMNKDDDNFGYVDLNLKYRLGANWTMTVMALAGKDRSYTNDTGSLCTSCAYEALNGTVQSNGSTTAPAIPGTTNVVNQLPLTTSNALDVWSPTSTNLTSASTRALLTDSDNIGDYDSNMEQLRYAISGPIFDLPGGPLKLAAGFEYQRWALDETTVGPQGNGPADSGGSSIREYNFERHVYSAYAEADMPLVSRDMGIPFVQKLEADVSGRYDDYEPLVGSTFNPKFGVNWQVVDAIRIRYDISTSFVAPPMDLLANNINGAGYSASANQFDAPISAYPNVTQLPGVTCNATICSVPSADVGLQVKNGNPGLHSATGNGWNVGVDITPDFLPNFDASITLFNNKDDGGATNAHLDLLVTSPPLQNKVTFYPTGATPAQIAAQTNGLPVLGSLPAELYYIFHFNQANILYLNIQGLDVAVHYRYDTDNFGTFRFGGNLTEFTRFTETNAVTLPTYSILNTSGLNPTFPSVQEQMRDNVEWLYQDFDVNLFWNFTGGYRNWSSSTVAPIIYSPTTGNPIGGGDAVQAFSTFDLRVAYNFTSEYLGGDQIYVEAQNIFNTPPPYYNGQIGYDGTEANPLGRLLSVGLKAKF